MRVWIGALAFLLPFLSLVTSFGVNLASFLFLVSALILLKPSRDALVRHWPEVRWVVLAFLLHFLFVLACALLRGDKMNVVEKPVRTLLSVTVLAAVVAGAPVVVLGVLPPVLEHAVTIIARPEIPAATAQILRVVRTVTPLSVRRLPRRAAGRAPRRTDEAAFGVVAFPPLQHSRCRSAPTRWHEQWRGASWVSSTEGSAGRVEAISRGHLRRSEA